MVINVHLPNALLVPDTTQNYLSSPAYKEKHGKQVNKTHDRLAELWHGNNIWGLADKRESEGLQFSV